MFTAPFTQLLRQVPAVTAILGTGTAIRVYKSGNAPQGTSAPYITLQSSLAPENSLDGVPLNDRDSVQLDAYSKDEKQCQTLAKAARDGLEGHAHCTGMIFDGFEPDTKLFRIGLQFDYFVDRSLE